MNKYMVVVNSFKVNVGELFEKHGMEIYYEDRHSHDYFGIKGNLTIDEVKNIPYVTSVANATTIV